MSALDLIEQAFRLIRTGNPGQARQILVNVLKENPRSAEAWALIALVETDVSRREDSLRRVIDHSDDAALGDWALRLLGQVKGVSILTPISEMPPLKNLDALGATGISVNDVLHPPTAPSSTPSKAAEMPLSKKPLPGEPPRPSPAGAPISSAPARNSEGEGEMMLFRSVGGWIMLIGVVFVILSLVIPAIGAALAPTGILPGWIGIGIVVIGGIVAGLGFVLGEGK
jgi:hypothetical protein